MKFLLLILTVLLVACLPNKSLIPIASSDSKLKVQNILETLQSKPEWLFPGDACPFDVMPDFESQYLRQKEDIKKQKKRVFSRIKFVTILTKKGISFQ